MSAARHLDIPFHTREEFYELERTSSTRHEFYGGHIVAMAGGSPRHARIIAEATRVLGNALIDRRCFAVPNDQMVRIEDNDVDAYPDLTIYCEEAKFDSRFPQTLLEPLVLVEVLSPSTRNVDLTTKLGAYFQIPTLTDYLIIWQDKIRLDQFVRVPHPDDIPEMRHHLTRDSRVRLDALGIEFSLGELYRFLDDLPEGAL
ncbi:Uma2 family endonuclease [bacterium]|nr:MAG: Uma2 family endonuclease [bacterium]